MTAPPKPKRSRQHATAARQALRLCEADLTKLTCDASNPTSGAGRIQGRQRRNSPSTTRAALRAAGVPPLVAAALRRRLRLIPEQDAEQ
jgi:hypothetical protein